MITAFEMEVPIGKYVISYPERNSREDYFKSRPFFEKIKEGSVGVEVGVLECNNAVYAHTHCKFKMLYLVDEFKEYFDIVGDLSTINQDLWEEIYKSNICRMKPFNVKFIRKSSTEAPKDFKDNSLDFVYIDANHIKKYVIADIKAWFPKVKPGGLIGGHDWIEAEVRSAVTDWIVPTNYDLCYGFNDWWVVK